MNYTYFVSKNVVTATFDDGTTKTVFADCPRYYKALDAINAGATGDELAQIMDGLRYIKYWAAGQFEIRNNQVTWLKHPEYQMPQSLCDRLMEYASNGYPVESFVKFLSRLLENPSNRSVETFYGFIEQQGLTIDADGFVMGYKGVREDLTDVYSGKHKNEPGAFLSMPRNHVDDDPNQPCSRGFHFGGWEYAHNFGSRMVLVRVDPKDLVCVPHDCSQGKVRVCQYTVVKEVTPETKMRSFFSDESEETDIEDEARFPNGRIECMECGTYCDAKDEFCRGCGSELPEPKEKKDDEDDNLPKCPNCGNEDILLSDGEPATFCPTCGLRLTD